LPGASAGVYDLGRARSALREGSFMRLLRIRRRRLSQLASAAAVVIAIPAIASTPPQTLPSPYLVKQITAPGSTSFGSNPAQFTAVGDIVFFSADDHLSGSELWISDGTTAGTVRMGDQSPGLQGANPNNFAAVNGRLFYQAGGPGSATQREMWTSNGTIPGTFRVADVDGNTSLSSQPRNFAPLGSQVVFSATVGGDRELYISNGTSGATRLANIHTGGSSDPQLLTAHGGRVYFTALHSDTGRELYSVAPGGTPQIIVDRPGLDTAGPHTLWSSGQKLYFNTGTSDTGFEPWVTDGTPGGTYMLGEISAGPLGGAGSIFRHWNGQVIFRANDQTQPFPDGIGVYATDGTAGSIERLHDFPVAGGGITDDWLNVVDGRIVMIGNGSTGNSAGLWVSEGTESSLHRLLDLYPSNSRGAIWETLAINEDWLLVVSQNQPPPTGGPNFGGFEMWLTDGTAAHTFRLTDPAKPWQQIEDITLAGTTVFFRGTAPAGQFVLGPELYGLDISSLIPEPSGAAMLLAGGCMLLRRRGL
jgi:ELWxxDGT repeat protein